MSLILIGSGAASDGSLTAMQGQFEGHSIRTVDLTVAQMEEEMQFWGNNETDTPLIVEFRLRVGPHFGFRYDNEYFAPFSDFCLIYSSDGDLCRVPRGPRHVLWVWFSITVWSCPWNCPALTRVWDMPLKHWNRSSVQIDAGALRRRAMTISSGTFKFRFSSSL
jgi:hypothetical protein